MRSWWTWLGRDLGRRVGMVSAVGLLLTLALGLGATRLAFVTSNSSYLDADNPAQVENQAYQSDFGGDPMVTMFTMRAGSTIDDLFTPHNVAELQRVARRLRTDPAVFSVITPLDAIDLSDALVRSPDGNPADSMAGDLLVSAVQRDPSPTGAARRLADALALARTESTVAPSERVIANPAWVHALTHDPDGSIRLSSSAFFPNDGHAVMTVFLRGGLSIEHESAAARTVEQVVARATFQHATTLTTGTPALLRTINDYLRGGMLTLGAIAAGVMVAILALLFTVRWRLLPFAIVTVGLVWAFGLAGWVGIPLTLASIAALPVLLGIGVDYAVQLHARVDEEELVCGAPHPTEEAARRLGPALVVVIFDAVFAFAALLLADVPMIRQFGWLLIVGVIAVCLCSIVGVLAVLGVRHHRAPAEGARAGPDSDTDPDAARDERARRAATTGWLSRATVRLGSIPARAAVPLTLAALAVFAGGLAVEGRVALQTDPLQWVDPGAQVVTDVHALRAGIGTDNEVGALVRTSAPWSDGTVAYVASFSEALAHRYADDLFPGTGIVNLVDQFIDVPGASAVPPLGKQVEAVYDLAPPDIQRTTATDGGRDLGIIFRARTATLDELQPVVQALQHADAGNGLRPPPGTAVAPGGIAVIGVGLLDALASSRTALTGLAIAFVGAFLALRLRSLVRALLSLVPVLVAAGVVSLIAWGLGLELSPLTAVSGPLVVAVCTEFTSLLLLRFVEERGRGADPVGAMRTTASRTGRAFIVSGLTAVAGIGVIASSPWPLLRGFGIIVGMNVAIALLSALIVLPPVLVWAESDGRSWVSRRLVHLPDDATGPVPGHQAQSLSG